MPQTIVEVCAGSLADCLIAQACGAHRIELNSALALGGLSASLAILKQAQARGVTIPIVCMVRPRGGGFCYTETEQAVMFDEAQLLLEAGAKGIAFGFLTSQHQVDKQLTQRMIALCQQYRASSVFHRAFDCVQEPSVNLVSLIELGCTRVLTSGMAPTAWQGREQLMTWQARYGQQIEFCAAAGITAQCVANLCRTTGIYQVHGSFKHWLKDPTTYGNQVNFAYDTAGDYEQTSREQLQAVLSALQ